MARANCIVLQSGGRTFELSFNKYRDDHASTPPYRSSEIWTDQLLLPEKRTVAEFKDAVRAATTQSGPAPTKFLQLLDEVSRREFGSTFQAVVEQQKEALRRRYAHAGACSSREFQMNELRACAVQGHVQANLDLGVLMDAEGSPESVDFFCNAHNLGHPESLLCLSRTFFRAGEAGEAVRVLLLGAWCESIRCAQALLLIRDHRLDLLQGPECMAALEESRGYGSMRAMYLLGFVLLHAESCRDEARGSVVMQEAGKVRHPRADKGMGPRLEGGQRAAGTLPHFEALIDRELLAIRSKELEPKFLEQVAQLPAGADDEARAAFGSLLQRFNPVPDRMVRRVADWLEGAKNEPVDEAKLRRMEAFLMQPEQGRAKEGGHE